MSRIIVALVLVVAGCGTGEKSVVPGTGADGSVSSEYGVTPLVAENPERLREVVMGLIGEGSDAAPALEIIDRYEADLRFVFEEKSASDNLPDSAAVSLDNSSFIDDHRNELAIIYRAPQSRNTLITGNARTDRVRRFSRNSLSIAIIGLNECSENFSETGDDRFARRGLAHGYIALISGPSPTQKSQIIEKVKIFQQPLLKR